jgi:hypothetical protein
LTRLAGRQDYLGSTSPDKLKERRRRCHRLNKATTGQRHPRSDVPDHLGAKPGNRLSSELPRAKRAETGKSNRTVFVMVKRATRRR